MKVVLLLFIYLLSTANCYNTIRFQKRSAPKTPENENTFLAKVTELNSHFSDTKQSNDDAFDVAKKIITNENAFLSHVTEMNSHFADKNSSNHARLKRSASEAVENGNALLSHLSELNSLFAETKFTQTAAKFLNSAGFVGGLIGTLLSLGEEEDDKSEEILRKIDEQTELMKKGFENVKSQIDHAKNELQGFIAKENFGNEVQDYVDNLIKHVNEYLKSPTFEKKDSLLTLCKAEHKDPKSLLNKMESKINRGGVTEQLKAQDYVDASFDQLQTLYQFMIMQILVSYPICQNLRYGQPKNAVEIAQRNDPIINTIKKIEQQFVNENVGRNNNFWDTEIFGRLMRKHMAASTDKAQVRDSLWRDLKKRYWKTDYTFAVGVYGDPENHDRHLFDGKVIYETHNGMGAFVMRNRYYSSYQICRIQHKTNYLPQLFEYVLEMCPKSPSIAVMGKTIYSQLPGGDAFNDYRFGDIDIFVANPPS